MTDNGWFFDYFRRRAMNAQQLPVAGTPLAAEQLILATAGIEALAGYWDRMWPAKRGAGAERVAGLLEVHGDVDVWGRIALPPLLRFARLKAPSLLGVLTGFGDEEPDARKRDFREDPTWQAVRLAVAGHPQLREVERFRYSHILYTQYRCRWVHELAGPGDNHPIWHRQALDEPWYDNLSNIDPTAPGIGRYGLRRILVLPLGLILRTFGAVVDSMQRAADAEGKDLNDATRASDPFEMAPR